MRSSATRIGTLLLTLAFSALAADVANMGGEWHLNVKRSKWGQKPAPQSVIIKIDHQEPKLQYSGKVVNAQENTSTFSFDGAIDGKEYSLKDDNAERKITVSRLSPVATTSTIRSADGKTEEVTTTRLSQDGKNLIRRIRLTSPEGNRAWTEVYDRK